ncbi:MAG: hypothetical protein KAT70_07120 [Thermoplasmata archaeon]|nr:hypothetical protein [Thermoplasmata archaeon]
MRGIVIAFLGTEEGAGELGKRGSSTDITYFNLKKGEVVFTTMLPSRYPEKIQPLAHVLGVAHHVVFEVKELSPVLGEQVIATAHSGHKRAWVMLQNYITKEEVLPLFEDAGIEPLWVEDGKALRQEVEALGQEEGEGEGVTVADQSFNVKGVGTVVLGFVLSGIVKKHDKVRVSPGEKECIIRSIQMQDEDQEQAGPGSRVGFALRGIDAEDIPRGSILSTRSFPVTEKGCFELDRSKYWRGALEKDTVLHLSTAFQFVPAKVTSTEKLELSFDKPLVDVGRPLLVLQLDSGKQRVVGSARLV